MYNGTVEFWPYSTTHLSTNGSIVVQLILGCWDFFLWSYNGTTKGNLGFSFTLGFNENYTDIFCSVKLHKNVTTVITKVFTI